MSRSRAPLGIEGRGQGLNDRYSSDVNKLFPGKIVALSYEGPPGGYQAGSTYYDIEAALPDSAGLVIMRAQVPSVRLWPDDFYINAEALIGTFVVGLMLGESITWIFYEPPRIEMCPQGSVPGSTGAALFMGSGDATTVVPPSGGGSSEDPSLTPLPGEGQI